MATPFETGLAARQGMQAGISDLLMGIRTGQNERDLSLRERGYEARQKENDLLLPYKMAEIESQNTFRKAQADDMLRKSKIQNSLIEIQSAISPIATEMSFIAKVDSDKLRNYQIPDLTFENQDKQMSDYSKAAARKELEILKQSLLDQDDEYQEIEQIVSTARAYSRDPTEPSPLKAGVREMIPLLRQNGFRGLNEFQTQKLLPLLDQYGLVRSADYQKKVSDREKNLRKDRELDISEVGAVAKVSDGLMISPEVKVAADFRLNQLFNNKSSGRLSPKYDGVFQLKIKQAAQTIRDGANAKDVIEKLTKMAVAEGQINDSPNEISAFKFRVQSRFKGDGINMPDYYTRSSILLDEGSTPGEE